MLFKLALALVVGWIIGRFNLQTKIFNAIVAGLIQLIAFIKGLIDKKD